jgi:hypothetical protein
MRKGRTLAMLMAVCVVGQMELRANGILFAMIPLNRPFEIHAGELITGLPGSMLSEGDDYAVYSGIPSGGSANVLAKSSDGTSADMTLSLEPASVDQAEPASVDLAKLAGLGLALFAGELLRRHLANHQQLP